MIFYSNGFYYFYMNLNLRSLFTPSRISQHIHKQTHAHKFPFPKNQNKGYSKDIISINVESANEHEQKELEQTSNIIG